MYFWKLPLFSWFFIFLSRLDQKVHRVKSGVVLRLGKGQKFETSDSSRFLTHFDSGESMEWIRHLECILTQKLEILRPSVHSFFVTYYGDICHRLRRFFAQVLIGFCHESRRHFAQKCWQRFRQDPRRHFAQVLVAFSSRTSKTFWPICDGWNLLENVVISCPSVHIWLATNFWDILHCSEQIF